LAAGIMKLSKSVYMVILTLLLGAGFFLGGHLNSVLSSKFLSGESGLLYFFSRPGYEYLYLQARLNSSDEMARLSAYYALWEYKRADHDLLIGKYKSEDSVYVKRTLVWMMGSAENSAAVVNFIRGEYKTSPREIQREMLRSVKRLDASLYEKLVSELKADREIIKDIN
jgi:hypothetical protein